jgi:hypothetical protein
MPLWAVVERDGELVSYGIPKRKMVLEEGFAVCMANVCKSTKIDKSRKIFCLECLRLPERGGGSISFETCFRPRVRGDY